ncbi:MAG TPA: glycosyltransferase family 87 protein [Trichormus sp.]
MPAALTDSSTANISAPDAADIRADSRLVTQNRVSVFAAAPTVGVMIFAGIVLIAIPPAILQTSHLPCKLTHVHDVVFSLAIAITGTYTFMRQRSSSARLAVTLAALAAAFYLQVIDLASDQSNAVDYMQVVVGAMSFVLHGSPYFAGTSYVLYPPFYAQSFAAVFSSIANFARFLAFHPQPPIIWQAVQYLFQNVLFFSVLALGALCHRFCRYVGKLTNPRATLLTVALIVPSAAVFWTVRKYQANIFVTDLLLLAMMLVDRSPALAALSLVTGANIKIYPALLGAAWFLGKRFKACAWAAGWLSLFILAETLLCGRVSIWKEYFQTASNYISTLPVETPKWLMGSPNLLNETYRLLACFGCKNWTLQQIAQAVHIEQLLIVSWFAWRFFTAPQAVRKQEQAAPPVTPTDVAAGVSLSTTQRVIVERSCDLISMMLIIGPSVLSDHYVMAIPISIWTAVTCNKRYRWLVVLGIACTLAWSTKSTLPISVEPLGLLLLALARRL